MSYLVVPLSVEVRSYSAYLKNYKMVYSRILNKKYIIGCSADSHWRNPLARSRPRPRSRSHRLPDQLHLVAHQQQVENYRTINRRRQRPRSCWLARHQSWRWWPLQFPALCETRADWSPHFRFPGKTLLPPDGYHEQAGIPGKGNFKVKFMLTLESWCIPLNPDAYQ